MKQCNQLNNGGNKYVNFRNLYESTYDENGRQIKCTLDKAAEIVGVPRKTLEDYYYQLKKAETLGIR